MKKVLIIDSHQLFRDFLRQKLSDDQIEVTLAQENRDSYPKMISILPNLVILDMSEDRIEEMAFLEKKLSDPNTANIPVIVTGPYAERSSMAALAQYGVVKYFTKPIQFDVFFESIGRVLHNPLSMDTTPCVLDLHRNGSIVFIEVALGLNRDKLALLQYKLSEIIENEEIDSPKVIIMLTNLDLSFVDGYNLEFLIDNVLACPRVHTKNVKILSFSTFVKDLVDGHTAYSGIEVSNNLPKVLNALVDTTITSSVSDLITDRILTPSYSEDDSSTVKTRFSSDTGKEENLEEGTVLNVAIIDSNLQSLALTKKAFDDIGATSTAFTTGDAFLNNYESGVYDLIVMDIILSDNKAFNVLSRMKTSYDAPPVVVYSQNTQREWISKSLSSGAKTYLVKPLKPQVLIQKCLALLQQDY